MYVDVKVTDFFPINFSLRSFSPPIRAVECLRQPFWDDNPGWKKESQAVEVILSFNIRDDCFVQRWWNYSLKYFFWDLKRRFPITTSHLQRLSSVLRGTTRNPLYDYYYHSRAWPGTTVLDKTELWLWRLVWDKKGKSVECQVHIATS